MYTTKERQEYNQHRERACKRLGITVNQYNWLRRKGEALRKLYEDNCNGLISKGDYAIKTFGYEHEIIGYVRPKGLYVYYQTDPRGASLYLDTKAIVDDDYTRAVCIY